MNFYWEMFAQSGNVEDYLKYKTLDEKNHDFRKTTCRMGLKPYHKLGGFQGF